MNRYWIPSHIHVCTLPEGVVLLDLRRNKYYGMTLRDRRALEALVCNWPATDRGQSVGDEPISPQQSQAIAASMLEKGLLVQEELDHLPYACDKVCVECDLDSAGQDPAHWIPVRPAHVFNFMLAYSSARLLLKLKPFHAVVASVAARKAAGIRTAPQFDEQRAEELTGIFRRLRPYAFSARGHCLLHALTLIQFLARYQVFPTWVIGVKARPWGAHSWVQHANTVFDCGPDQVWEFTPILAV